MNREGGSKKLRRTHAWQPYLSPLFSREMRKPASTLYLRPSLFLYPQPRPAFSLLSPLKALSDFGRISLREEGEGGNRGYGHCTVYKWPLCYASSSYSWRNMRLAASMCTVYENKEKPTMEVKRTKRPSLFRGIPHTYFLLLAKFLQMGWDDNKGCHFSFLTETCGTHCANKKTFSLPKFMHTQNAERKEET